MSYSISVDQSKCIDCGACARECARHLPVYRNGQNGGNGLDCAGCLHCFAVCPQGAVVVEGLESNDHGQAPPISPAAMRGLLARRRSYRSFEERPIEPQTLETLIRAAACIPSGGNSHSHRLTVITTGEARKRLEQELGRIYRWRKALLGNALLRSVFGLHDRTYLTRVSYLMAQIARGEDPIFYNAPAVILVHSPRLIPTPREDSVLAAYNVVLTAEALGLGSCFVSLAQNAINASRTCKRMLGLDPKEKVYAVVVVGHPAVRFFRAVPRQALPVSRIR
jgi:nitroreductase/NAD-dependent dihydropyrimidine dehydrogenase PreA subunit